MLKEERQDQHMHINMEFPPLNVMLHILKYVLLFFLYSYKEN